MIKWFKRFFTGQTAYQPGSGRIVAVSQNSSSGISINEQTALTIPAFFHGLRTYGKILGSLEWNLLRHLDRGCEIARAHPVHRLLHDDPNEYQTAPEFRELMAFQSICYGNAYAYLERNGNYRVTAMIPLPPDRTHAILDGSRLLYRTNVNGNDLDLDPYEVFHLKGFSANMISGVPLVRLMADTLGLTKAEAEFAAKFYGGNANMGGVVYVPGALSDIARQNLKSSMEREYGGIGNAFRTLFLEEGTKYERISVAPEQAQFIEGRQFNLGDLARIVDLPPHILYDLARSTNNNIEHQGIELVRFCFAPAANKICKEANRKLLYESEKDAYETKLDLTPLMAGDALTQAQVDQANFNMLAITPNERRAKIGLNPIEGGDELYLNTAYLPLSVAIAKAQTETLAPEDNAIGHDDDTTTNDEPPAEPSAGIADPDGQPGPAADPKVVDDGLGRSILQPIIRDAIARLLRREAKAVENARKKYTDSAAFEEWYGRWEDEQREHIAEVLQPLAVAMERAGLKLNGYADHHIAVSRVALSIEELDEGARIEDAVEHLLGEPK